MDTLFFKPHKFPTPEARFEDALHFVRISKLHFVLEWDDYERCQGAVSEELSEYDWISFDCSKRQAKKEFTRAVWLDTSKRQPIDLDFVVAFDAHLLTDIVLEMTFDLLETSGCKAILIGPANTLIDRILKLDGGSGWWFSRSVRRHIES